MIDRIEELEKFTIQYYNESDEFLFNKKHLNLRNPTLKLVYSCYSVDFDLVMQDFKIFFENKLKTRFRIDTKIQKEYSTPKYKTSKYSLANQNLNDIKFYDTDYDLSEVDLRFNVIFDYSVDLRNKLLKPRFIEPKVMTRLFFYKKMMQNTYLKCPTLITNKKEVRRLEIFGV